MKPTGTAALREVDFVNLVLSCQQADSRWCAYATLRSVLPVLQWLLRQAWRVGRNTISLTSTSSGWLIAKAIVRAKESGAIAIS